MTWLLADLQQLLRGVGAGAGRGAGAGAHDDCEAVATPPRLAGPAPEVGRRHRRGLSSTKTGGSDTSKSRWPGARSGQKAVAWVVF